MNKNPTSKSDRVPLFEKASLGVGALSAFFGYAAVSVLAYPVYNMKLHVPAFWVGFALMVPRIWDAFTDPIMGKISDNCHSRFGRRKPFIVLGAVMMGVLFAFLWLVPQEWSDQAKIAYFIVMQITFFTFYTVFSVPYNALTYEMTPDYNERNRVMAFNAFFHKMGELLGGWMLPLATVLGIWALGAAARDEAGKPMLTMKGVHMMVWFIGIFIMAGMGSVPGLFVKERFKDKAKIQKKVKIFESAGQAFSSLPFLILVSIIVLNTLSGILAMGIDQYLLVYFMNDGNESVGLIQKGLLTSGYGVIGFAAIPFITYLANKFGKKGSLYFVYGLMVFGGIMKWFIFTPGHPIINVSLGFASFKLDPVILIDPLLCGPMWVAVKIMLASMMADICDEDELKSGVRREGMYGAVFSWIEKMVVSLAYFATGAALMFANFNPELGANQAEGTFTRMRLFLAGGPAITALFAIVALYFYPLTAQRAAETRRKLEERRGQISI